MNDNIVDGNIRKVAILNDNLLIVFTGSGKSCGGIVEHIQGLDLKKYCLDHICNAIHINAKEL